MSSFSQAGPPTPPVTQAATNFVQEVAAGTDGGSTAAPVE